MIRIALCFPNGDMVIFHDKAISPTESVSAQVSRFRSWAKIMPGVARVSSEGFRVRIDMKENPSA